MSKQIKRTLDLFYALLAGIVSTLLAHSHYFASAGTETYNDTSRPSAHIISADAKRSYMRK